MKSGGSRALDVTGDTATGNVAGDSLIVSVLSRIEDDLERVLILAHIGLDISLTTLARELKMDRRELAAHLDRILAKLRNDEEMAAMLSDVRRAGQPEHYHALAFRLNLQDWFCSYCERLMVQPEIGRPRNTCSARCRRLLYKAGGTGWKDQYQRRSKRVSRAADSQLAETHDATAKHSKLVTLMETAEKRTLLSQPDIRSRNRALLLLGFTCPIPLTPSDLADLDVNDIIQIREGVEVRLYRRANRGIRYVVIPENADPALNPAQAVTAWRRRLVQSRRTTGPLFIQMDRDGRLPPNTVRLTSRAVTNVIDDAILWSKRVEAPELKPTMPLPDFLNRVSFR